MTSSEQDIEDSARMHAGSEALCYKMKTKPAIQTRGRREEREQGCGSGNTGLPAGTPCSGYKPRTDGSRVSLLARWRSPVLCLVEVITDDRPRGFRKLGLA